MIRTIIISPDQQTGEDLEKTLGAFEVDVQVCRNVDHYPASDELMRVLRSHAPEVVFLSFENEDLATQIVRILETRAAGVQVVAIHSTCDARLLRESMRAGVREFLSEPFEQGAVAEALRNVQVLVLKRPPVFDEAHQILSFIPSKAGVGSTTLALNISSALARPGEGKEDKKVLLTDLDLNSGMLRFLLQLFPEYSLIDAVENVDNLDENIWPQVTTSRFHMDLLHSGRVNPNLRIEPEQVTKLLAFMRRNYDTLVFDHSGNLERYSLEVMQESKQIFLVCTPEIPSLHLAREKMTFLRTMGLDGRVFLLLNRVPKRSMFTVDQVEELVGAKVAYSFSNDYFAVNRATTQAECLAPDSVIGAQCADFVRNLGDLRGRSLAGGRGKRFLEFFTTQSQEELIAQD